MLRSINGEVGFKVIMLLAYFSMLSNKCCIFVKVTFLDVYAVLCIKSVMFVYAFIQLLLICLLFLAHIL